MFCPATGGWLAKCTSSPRVCQRFLSLPQPFRFRKRPPRSPPAAPAAPAPPGVTLTECSRGPKTLPIPREVNGWESAFWSSNDIDESILAEDRNTEREMSRNLIFLPLLSLDAVWFKRQLQPCVRSHFSVFAFRSEIQRSTQPFNFSCRGHLAIHQSNRNATTGIPLNVYLGQMTRSARVRSEASGCDGTHCVHKQRFFFRNQLE